MKSQVEEMHSHLDLPHLGCGGWVQTEMSKKHLGDANSASGVSLGTLREKGRPAGQTVSPHRVQRSLEKGWWKELKMSLFGFDFPPI